jgi:hypothetical protein
MDNEVQITSIKSEARTNYQTVVAAVIGNTVDFLDKKSIYIDHDKLNKKMSELKIIHRDGQDHEYAPSSNTLYFSLTNQEGQKYSDEDMIIFTTHELLHLVSSADVDSSFYDTYTGFDEFFTEYLTSIIVSRIGGIGLESYYRHEVKGYFGNDNDNKIIKNLCSKVGLQSLLSAYVSRDLAGIEKLVGKETLTAMNEYHQYYNEISNNADMPQKVLNENLTQSQQNTINGYVNRINQCISSLAQPSTTTSR